MILRLIVNELSRRGCIGGSRMHEPYTLNSMAALSGASAAADAEAAVLSAMAQAARDDGFITDSVVDSVDSRQYTYSDEPSASFILDGYPRTAAQAATVDKIIPINLVVNIVTPMEIILERISNRWIHAASGRVYNTTFNAPRVAGKDDVTGEALTRREDDDPQVWKARLDGFHKACQPLLEHYDRMGVLVTVQGDSSDEITPKLLGEFERRFC